MGHAVEAVDIGAHVAGHGLGLRVALTALLQQLDPPPDARERGAELVGRLARHTGPEVFPRRVAARADDEESGEQQQQRGDRLQRRNDAQPVHERRVAVVDDLPPAVTMGAFWRSSVAT